jgi:rfaE bifunctional protein kinase chain/domain
MTTLPDFRAARVLVVGDVMLDRYWFGDVQRISPEAPVPVVRVERTEERPGGAANVARNAVALGARVSLLSVVGEDEAGTALRALTEAAGVSAVLHRDASVSTTVKLRVIGRQQQLIRIDFENTPSREVLADKLADFEALLAGCDVVVMSDYGKGGLTHIVRMIELARAAGKRILVDPKGDDYSRYRGASLLTPNRAELREVIGRWTSEADLAARAERLRAELALEALLVTRSEEGMTLFGAGSVSHESTKAREVFDVSGAGDTVIATLATMLAAGAPLVDAMRAANHAAGIVVGKLGTAVVTRAELAADLAAVR